MRRALLVLLAALLFIPCTSSASMHSETDPSVHVVARGGSTAQPSANIIFSNEAILITDVRPGSTVILFAVERVIGEDFSESVVIWDERLSDADSDGEVSLSLERPMSPFTVMAVVDENNGRYVVATPGFIPLTISPTGKLHGNDKGEPIEFQNDMPYAEALVVRPGKGAWLAHGFDGTVSDSDGHPDGRVGIRFDAMTSIHGQPGAPGPDGLRPQDLLIVINPRTLAVYANDVKEKK